MAPFPATETLYDEHFYSAQSGNTFIFVLIPKDIRAHKTLTEFEGIITFFYVFVHRTIKIQAHIILPRILGKVYGKIDLHNTTFSIPNVTPQIYSQSEYYIHCSCLCRLTIMTAHYEYLRLMM